MKPRELKPKSGDKSTLSPKTEKRGANMENNIEENEKIRRFEELTKLANSGNIYAKQELRFIRNGNKTAFEVLSAEECEHCHVLPNGRKISAEREVKALRGAQFNNKKREWIYFEIGGSKCSICGKTLSFKVERRYER